MPTRREALAGIGTFLIAPNLVEACPKRNPVNEKLLSIAAQLRRYPEVTKVLTYPDADARQALVHWEWVHFAENADQENFGYIERSQRELLTALRRAMCDCHVRLQSLLTEGLLIGKEKGYIADCMEVTRSCLWQQLVTSDEALLPSSEKVTGKLKNIAMLQKKVSRLVDVRDPDGRVVRTNSIHHSAAAYCGAPFLMHHLYGLTMIPTEEAATFDKAIRAEWNKEDEQRWVHDERNAHFLKTLLAQNDPISHFVCGYGHDLAKDAANNTVSLAVVRTRASTAHRKRFAQPTP